MPETPAELVAKLLPCKMADPLLMAEGLCRLVETPPVLPEVHGAVRLVFAGVLGTTPALAYGEASEWHQRVRPFIDHLLAS